MTMNDESRASVRWTPGPWSEDGYGTIYAGAKQIAVTQWGKGVSGKHYMHNARLITAAPDLYEALDSAVRLIDDSQYDLSSFRAALAKARGEA